MCGIAGILSLAPDRPVDADALCAMARQLLHRGPDEDGFHIDPQRRCGLAFRRLSIIDLATGHQPIGNEDGSVWVVFNGEVYNFRALRGELETRGHRFATHCDSEVIVHLYEERGADCFERLDGMFAIAIWDAARGRLLLARDRFGKKPLHFAVQDGRLYFASELKAILGIPGVPRRLDPQSLHRYLIFQYVPAPHSIYREFHKLLPGHRLECAAHQAGPREQRAYWALPRTPFEGSYHDAQARLADLLTCAVEKRLVADVPLGAFLSGGIDSSIVVGLMRKLGVQPLRTFSIGFPEAKYDETAHARTVARLFATEHHEHIVTPRAREVLDTLAWHYDEPFGDSSAIPTYYVSRWTREAVTVALTGDGGDECFAGYDRYRAAQLAGRVDWIPAVLRGWGAAVARWLPHHEPKSLGNRAYRFFSALAASPAQRYLSWVNVFPPTLLVEGYRPEFAATIAFDEPLRWFERLYAVPGSFAERAIDADFVSYLPYDLLTKVDSASMACGLECRCPFLDPELVAFARGLPIGWRLGPGGGKRILKDWACGLLPREILQRRKMGFGVPVGQWFRGELQDLLRQHVLDPAGLSCRVFRREWLSGVVEAHITGRSNYEHPLWALLMLELWYRRWQPITAMTAD